MSHPTRPPPRRPSIPHCPYDGTVRSRDRPCQMDLSNLNPKECEKALLAAAIDHPELIDVVPELRPGHFYSRLRGKLWEQLLAMKARGESIDPASVVAEVRMLDIPALDLEFILDLSQFYFSNTPEHIQAYAASIHGSSMRRDLAVACYRLAHELRIGETTPDEVKSTLLSI